MKNTIELLAPGGDVDAVKAAIVAGADAIYCGLDRFNARSKAANISLSNLVSIVHLAHEHDCKIFITLNILIIENEIPAFIELLKKITTINIDGVIIQDIGMLFLISEYFKQFQIHASTQMTTHNRGQILFLKQFKTQRLNLSRELNLHEVKELTVFGRKHNVLSEVFIHGSNCISFSGLCYFSSSNGGNSGNRGRCSQPCREEYEQTELGKRYPFNLKDNSAYNYLNDLLDAGVASLKVEGRIKKFDYIYTVVDVYRKQIDRILQNQALKDDKGVLYKVFNRDLTDHFLSGQLSQQLFIDNPRDNSVSKVSQAHQGLTSSELEKVHLAFYAEKDKMKATIAAKINLLNINKRPLELKVNGKLNQALSIEIKRGENIQTVFSDELLSTKATQTINEKFLLSRFKAFNETAYYIKKLDLAELPADLHLSFKSLTKLRNRILHLVSGVEPVSAKINIPKIHNTRAIAEKPALLVLIDGVQDIESAKNAASEIYYQLPNAISSQYNNLVATFKKHNTLIPYFPAILIGEDYDAATKFLDDVNPLKIVTNNTGIAYQAMQKGIEWIAGPNLNIVNSYSLVALQNKLKCVGAFVSNELNRYQIKTIKKPAGFKLYYSLYHPIELMTSRQCLFHQVTGCHKSEMDAACMPHCEKSAVVCNKKQMPFVIEKNKACYNKVYSHQHFLNTAIVSDLPQKFDGFGIDLRKVKTDTEIKVDQEKLIDCFNNLLKGINENEIENLVLNTSCTQYQKGI